MTAGPDLPLAELEHVFDDDIDPARLGVERVYEPVASASAGIWRVTNDAVSNVTGLNTAILKVVAHSGGEGNPNWLSGEEPAHWYYWKREVLAYDTGLLDSLPGGLRAPACLLAAPRADGSVALWLEDVRAQPATTWTLARYGIAARHLGQMQGAFVAGRPLPDHEWLSHDWMRSYVRQRDADMELVERTELWDDPRLAAQFTEPPVARQLAMRRDQPRFLDALDTLPRTLCHLDLHPANLFGDPDGLTTAIDWSFAGIGAIGEDAGNLVPDAVLDFHFDPAQIDDLYETVADGYTAGLRDAGWQGSDADVRLGLAATIAAKYAWIAPATLRVIAEGRELLNRRATAESLRWWAPTLPFLLDRADEARELL